MGDSPPVLQQPKISVVSDNIELQGLKPVERDNVGTKGQDKKGKSKQWSK